ncbi:PREDICTED: ubiquinol-cytochrome-c reductase complex assembly factor 1 [Theobroma cacao]|uniref:Ubiquinol-cytochrome-c reductase complex assembly factor 1 n=1 Tax=Theobroma cacao TaxID=3641 RepID=A0AB32W3U8_THECC|nr:PREDICTED: ubiquinol-cytochrome-c reductase complex assembly factor 1 [Theobroma cacao]
MLPRWNRALAHLSKLRSFNSIELGKDFSMIHRQSYAAVAPAAPDSPDKSFPARSTVNLDKMFWSKPCSLALAPDSPLRVEDPKYDGIKRIILKMMLFYSKQSKSIRGANVIYRRVLSQVDKPAIYEVFNLEKTFKMTFSLLVLHMWLCLRRLKAEGKDGVELGQYLYEIYNHDVELRVSKAGVNLLLTKWMKELEKIFYGNIVAYNAALLPEAKQEELTDIIWRNVFSDDGTSKPDAAALRTVQAMARYVRREVTCLSLTDKEAMFSGNFMFTSLENSSPDPMRR